MTYAAWLAPLSTSKSGSLAVTVGLLTATVVVYSLIPENDPSISAAKTIPSSDPCGGIHTLCSLAKLADRIAID